MNKIIDQTLVFESRKQFSEAKKLLREKKGDK